MSFKSVWISRFHSIPLFSLQFICGGSRLSGSLAFAECILLMQFSVFLCLWVSCHLAAGSRDGIGVRLNPFHKIKNDASFHQEACRGLVFTLFLMSAAVSAQFLCVNSLWDAKWQLSLIIIIDIIIKLYFPSPTIWLHKCTLYVGKTG